MKAAATLKKISEHLSISISTVSRALKDHPDVSADTKRRVKELAEMLDYEPNAFAVNLRKRHSNVYGVIVPEISSFFYHAYVQALEEQARLDGYSIIILQSMDDPETEKQNLRFCRHNHVAGVFVSLSRHTRDMDMFEKLGEAEIPVLFVDKVPEQGGYHSVSYADLEAGRLAAEKMAELGKKKWWAIFGDRKLSITQRREQGFRQGLKELGIKRQLRVSYAGSEREAGQLIREATHAQLEGHTLFCMSDEILCGVMRALYARKLEIPGQVSVLAMSHGFLPRLFNPEVAYVETNGFLLGKMSYQAMQELRLNRAITGPNLLSAHFHPGGSL